MQPASTYVDGDVPWVYATLDFPHFGVLTPPPKQSWGLYPEVADLQEQVQALLYYSFAMMTQLIVTKTPVLILRTQICCFDVNMVCFD